MTDTQPAGPTGPDAPLCPSRRALLVGLGVVPLAAVAGCSVYGDKSSSSAPKTGETLTKTSDVPVGGGVILDDVKVVVTQPVAGTFEAFSAVCTHQSCTVSTISDGIIECTCHHSKFDLDGQVVSGPAPSPLPAQPIKVEGQDIVVA